MDRVKGACQPAAMGEYSPLVTFMDLPYTSDPQGLDIGVVGVPWDGGTNMRVGSRHAPREIRNMSARLRHFHPTMEVSPFELCTVADVGDVPVNSHDQAASLQSIETFYARLASSGVIPLTAGGDHLITLPIFRAIAREAPLGMVQFDAHSDTSETSAEGEKYSAATPFRHAVEEGLLDPKRVIQIGIRGPVRSRDKMQWAHDVGMRLITMDDLYEIGVDGVIGEARRLMGDGPTYISFDIDGIDPAFAPGTGTPVIGGVTTYEAQRILRGLRGLNLVGGDVTEVSPPYDVNNCTALVGASLLFEILCLIADARASRASG